MLKKVSVSEKILKSSYHHQFGPFFAKKFVENVIASNLKLRAIIKRKIKLKMNEENDKNFQDAKKSWVYFQPFS